MHEPSTLHRRPANRFAISLLICALLALALACSSDDSDDPARDTSTATSASSPTESASQPLLGGTPTTNPALDEARTEAGIACPVSGADACIDAWVSSASTDLPAALCVGDRRLLNTTWFIETPADGAMIGDSCQGDASHTIAAIKP